MVAIAVITMIAMVTVIAVVTVGIATGIAALATMTMAMTATKHHACLPALAEHRGHNATGPVTRPSGHPDPRPSPPLRGWLRAYPAAAARITARRFATLRRTRP